MDMRGHMHEHDASWTDGRIELLKKLWADGLSASQIMDELGGGVTRNGVIGKVHRLGLSGRGRTNTTPKENQAKGSADAALARKIVAARNAKAAEPKPAIPAQTHHTDSGGGLQRKLANKAERRGPQASGIVTSIKNAEAAEAGEFEDSNTEAIELPADESQFAVTFFDVTQDQCRHPLGDPSNLETFRFCGADQRPGTPYCGRHCRINYNQASR